MIYWREVEIKGKKDVLAVIDAGENVELLLTKDDLKFLTDEAWISADDGILTVSKDNEKRSG